MTEKVGIVGVGMTEFGELWNKSYRDLITEAGIKAIEDAKIKGEEIEEIYGGSMSPGVFASQEHISAMIGD